MSCIPDNDFVWVQPDSSFRGMPIGNDESPSIEADTCDNTAERYDTDDKINERPIREKINKLVSDKGNALNLRENAKK